MDNLHNYIKNLIPNNCYFEVVVCYDNAFRQFEVYITIQKNEYDLGKTIIIEFSKIKTFITLPENINIYEDQLLIDYHRYISNYKDVQDNIYNLINTSSKAE